MRHRITYIQDLSRGQFDPGNARVTSNSLSVRGLVASKEHRTTIGLSELPPELTSVLEQCHELHIRWTSPRLRVLRSPFASRVSSGLHVFFTPLEGHTDSQTICPLLQALFWKDLRCSSVQKSFTNPHLLSTRFSTTASFQSYYYVPTLVELVDYLQQRICSSTESRCQRAALSLGSAVSLDIDYDIISRVVVISSIWDQAEEDLGAWSEDILKSKDDDRVEIGILNEEIATEEEEVNLGGWLIVIGDDKKPKPTLFSFPSRHHILPSNETHPSPAFSASFDKPTGLHPTLRLTFHKPQHLNPPSPSCALHAYLTLPSALFLDRHAFTDPLFLTSHNLSALHSISGATDLEAPDWSIPQWGSASLFEISLPPPPATDGPGDASAAASKQQHSHPPPHTHTATIPLSARYLPPAPGGYANITVPWPAVFWACAAQEGAKFPVNPFDRRELGYDGVFGDRTLFYHVQPQPQPQPPPPPRAQSVANEQQQQQLASVLTLPVLDVARSGFVEAGTVASVVVGFLWVCWTLFRRSAPLTATVKEAGRGKKVRTGEL